MRKITLLIALIGMALTASAQNWTSFNSYGFQRKINGTDTLYRVLGAGVNTPYLYLRSDWSMKQLLDGKANLVGGNTFTGGGQIIQDSQPTVELKSTLFNQSFKLGYFDAVGNFEIRNHQNKKLLQLTNPISSTAQPSLGIGNFTGSIPGESQLYVYGGANGANIDARGRAEKDEANIDLEGSDWTTTPNSLGFSYFGVNNTAPISNTLGYIAKKLAMIRFNEANSALIVSNRTDSIVPIRFGINNLEIANISDKGWSYQSDFASVNSSNPRWMPDKGYVDGLVANKANTNASNINVANYKTALGLPSTGGYDLQSVTDRGNVTTNPITINSATATGINFQRSGSAVGQIDFSSNNLNISASNNLLFQPSGGNVGIGTTSPIVRLTTQDNSSTYSFHASGNNLTNGVAIGTVSGNYANIQGYKRDFSSVNDLIFQNQGGNVGIGTAAPSAKLHVTGAIWASSNDGNSTSVVRNVDLANYVTTNTNQNNISGAKVFTSPITVTAEPTGNLHVIRVQDLATQGKETAVNVFSSANTTFTITDGAFGYSTNLAIYVDASTAAVNIILPAVANTTGKKILIFKVDSSANAVTINGPGALIYINGSPTYTLTSQYASVEIHANSTQYYAK